MEGGLERDSYSNILNHSQRHDMRCPRGGVYLQMPDFTSVTENVCTHRLVMHGRGPGALLVSDSCIS